MRLARYKNIGNFILIAGILLCCLYAVHDMQTAEGIGLFLALQSGLGQRELMDATVSIVCILALAVLVYLPCRLLSHRSPAAYTRLLVGYLAAVPVLSLAELIAQFRADSQVFLWDIGFLSSLESWIYSIAPFFQIWVPLFIILFATARVSECFSLAKWHKAVMALMAVAGLVLFLIPSAGNPLLYLMGYLGLLIAFDCWESLFEAMPQMSKWYNILFLLLLCRGIYRIIVLISRV